MEKMKIIIDTDIGDDIDDAFALAFATNSDELDILGITTVFRNTDKRAKMCCALMQSLQKPSISVYAGIDQPLVAPIHVRDNDVYNSNGKYIPCQYLEEFESFNYESQHAVDFIIDSIRRYPEKITLVPIGPLTNIAVAIRKAPDIIGKIRSIVLMGGYFEGSKPEWNILCDPEAARIVFQSGAMVKAVGLDVTMLCSLDEKMVQEFKNSSSHTSRLLSSLIDKWVAHYGFESPVMHDPLTIGTLILEDLVEFVPKDIYIGSTPADYGRTIVCNPNDRPDSIHVQIATTVDVPRFFSLLKERIFDL